MSSGIIETIKEIALNVFEANNPVKVLFGTVTSVDPVTVKVSQYLTLTQEFLVINGTVEVNDDVTLIRCQGGQKYVVLGTRTMYVETNNPTGGMDDFLLDPSSLKVYLSPSDQFENLYATGNTNEAVQCQKIADEAGRLLMEAGVSVKVGSNKSTITERINESNLFGATVHIPIHTNAGVGKDGAGGALVLCRQKDKENLFVTTIYNNLANLVNNKDYGIRVRTDLAEINSSNAVVVYCECEFHDSISGSNYIINNIDKIASAISKGVVSAANSYVTKTQPATGWQLPCKGYYKATSPFGGRISPINGNWEYHTGVDLALNNYNIYHIDNGKVVAAGWNAAGSGYGNAVIIDHGNNYWSMYAHMGQSMGDGVYVKKDQVVTKNTVLGKQGKTGAVDGVHLHLEIRYGANDSAHVVDPTPILNIKWSK